MEKNAVVLVLSVWLLVGGSEAGTFSSKLIHRFSDEAKVLWTARNGNVANGVVSWPKRNSLEYLELLIENDLKRQRMKLGSQDPLLFPSQGSETLFFGNEFDWLHYTWIDIGTPNVSFLVALDAGSDLLWVPCDCIQCAPLSASYYNSLDKDLSEYNPSLSSSSKNLSCSHQLCESSSYCKRPNDPCPYIIEYDSDNTSSSGYLVEDKLHLKSFTDHAAESLVQASVIVGCGRKQTGGYLDGAAPDGLMGLGPGNISVPSLLAKAGLIQNSFSICFDENGSGRIYFGDKGLASQQSTPFLPIGGKYETYFVRVEHLCVGNSCLERSGFLALVDSGTSFTFLPPEIYDKVVLEFDKQVDARRISYQEDLWKYCYNVSSQEPFKIPSMRLKFAMNQSFEIHNHIYSYTDIEGFTVFCLTVLRGSDDFGIIGQNFMTGHRIVFDRENLKLGWSHSNCQDVSDRSSEHLTPSPNGESPIQLPTNEQQSTNNTPAVAPTVAGRASTKPSVASPLQIPTVLCLLSSLLLLRCLL
ncbi:aspartic proteinase-like protein 1 [Durio zibethinus]|uniref:Aspartic proteinase-like protein 1 n=1 Tax=Durio zibethinus TaxID=66656 RepID=A0A6P6B7L8_DURZI|nr:aspartic proteinase-like protein 1 [Durio zibethinus]